MLKICHITSKHAAFDTRIFHKECKALKSRYQVVLLVATALAPTAASPHPPSPGLYDGIEISYFSYRDNNFIFNLISILKTALKQKAVAYHIHDPELLPLAWILHLSGKKIIYDVHENYRESLKEHKASKLNQKLFYFFDHWAAKHCALILAERSYISLYQGRARNICVVENFCDVEALKPFRREDRSNCNKMVYVGTIHPHRGAIMMLEALNVLLEKGLPLMLDLIGKITDPGLLKKIEQLPYYAKIKNKIHWHGQLNITDSYRIAQESFVGICMIEALPNHSESYPTKLFEYMAVGLPIVATNVSLYSAVVERRECGICVPYEDVNAIAESIEKIYTDKELQKQFSQNGPLAVNQNYNWATEKNILLDFYRKVVRG